MLLVAAVAVVYLLSSSVVLEVQEVLAVTVV
jgi:hypothetical protein